MQPRRGGRARSTKVVSAVPGVGDDQPTADVQAGEGDLAQGDDTVGPGHVRHGHPHPVDRAAVQAHLDEPGGRVDVARCVTGRPASTRTSRTGAPEKPSTPARTEIRSSGVGSVRRTSTHWPSGSVSGEDCQ